MENPYILNLESAEDTPALVVLPLQGMFIGDKVIVQRQNVMASAYVELNTADLPEVFDVTPVEGGWYDIGDVSRWVENVPDNSFRYVSEAYVQLVPPELTVAKAELKNLQQVDSFAEYVEYWQELPQCVQNILEQQYATQMEELMNALQSVKHETTVDFNGTPLRVEVQGAIPKTSVALNVQVVDSAAVLSQGFDIKNATEIIAALDIKLLKQDGTEWQPEDGNQIAVSIGMSELGYADGSIVRMHHKHGDYINTFDIFVVLDGKVTLKVHGFSVFAVTRANSTQKADNVTYNTDGQNPKNTITMTVGQDKVFYNDRNTDRCTWQVEDTSGAIYYTVHSDGTPSSGTLDVPWIRIVALKESANVTLTFRYGNNGNNTETYKLVIEAPKATNKRTLYLKDDVNRTGRIIATLVDKDGKEIENGLAGAAFSWVRSDNAFIVPHAYGDDNASVNIAVDHAGLVEARKKDGKFDPIKYTVTAVLSDGETLEASYTVYYQSEILNSTFESPRATKNNYTFYPNGWPEMYWKTTAPGTGSKLTNDIEYGSLATGLSGTEFGVPRAADHDQGGVQFAELNAEAVGTLYQDIITAPGEEIEWSFAHAARRSIDDWASNAGNAMFIVIGATEAAQKLTSQDDLTELGNAAKTNAQNAGISADFLAGKVSVEAKDKNGATYIVWYHDAGVVPSNGNINQYYPADKNYGWTLLEGSYVVPEGQYRTRIFFASDSNKANFGNLIDAARAGQYKTYLVEYFIESFVGETRKVEPFESQFVSGEALVYSFVELNGLEGFLKGTIGDKYYYLHKIEINGQNYPYNIRYQDKASMYIENYPGTATDPTGKNTDYSQYDIVMQVYLRDTVVAVQKIIEFPTAMTTEQKLQLIDSLEDGYEAQFSLIAGGDVYNAVNGSVITQRSPDGSYVGYISMDNGKTQPPRDVSYTLTETDTTPLPGLKLVSTTYDTTMYKNGGATTAKPVHSEDSSKFTLSNETGTVAEIVVKNTYEEKQTVIEYKAVGKGKVIWLGTGAQQYEDAPTETLAFYSGKAIGAKPEAGSGATFVGWFLDEACTQPVQLKDGVQGSDNSFKPNANIIDKEKITFYAKFDTGAIFIERTGAEKDQVFVYRVVGGTGDHALDTYITVKCNENGYGVGSILEVADGTYYITEIKDWSWRFSTSDESMVVKRVEVTSEQDPDDDDDDDDDDELAKLGTTGQKVKATFSAPRSSDYWLSGISDVIKNVFKTVKEAPKP